MFSRKKFAFDNQEPSTVESKIVFLIDRTELTAVEYKISGQGEVLLSQPQTMEWQKDTLLSTLDSVCKDYNASTVNILLGQDLANVISLKVNSDVEDVIETATNKAASKFQADFSELGIDYTVIIEENKKSWVQLFITRKSFLNFLGDTLRQLKLDVTAVEPLGQALASRIKETDPYVILWGEKYLLVTLVYQGKIIHSETLSGSDIYKQIDSLISLFEATYSIDIAKVYMATKKLKAKKLTTKKKIEEIELDPFANSVTENAEFAVEPVVAEEIETVEEALDQVEDETTEKSDIIEKSRVVAPKPPLKLVDKEDDAMDSVTTPPASKSNAKLIAIIVTVLVVLVGMVVGGFFVYQNAMKGANESPEVITNDDISDTTPTAAPTSSSEVEDATGSSEVSTETDIDVADLSAEVLNGSGTPGAAGAVADILDEMGFGEVDTGNADSYDFDETVIQVKPGNDDLYELVLTELQDSYTVSQGDDLDEDYDYDVVVTVGSN